MAIRKGINEKNFNYWKDEIFIGLHRMDKQTAGIMANLICHAQEISKLKERIIKLEKRIIK
jgi:hypothetical protein